MARVGGTTQNHIATCYRAEREELGNRDCKLEERELESKKNSNAYRKKGCGGRNSKIRSSGSQRLRDGERTKATGYRVEREESMNRDREPA